MKPVHIIAALALFSFSNAEESIQKKMSIRPTAELGFLSVLDHRIQFDSNGTEIDYREDAGQTTLFGVTRFSVDVDFSKRHKTSILYQPLELKTTEIITRDLTVDNMTFASGTPVTFTYGFPFYRISYLYDFLEDSEREVAAGISFQIRNATITFESGDGTQLRTNRDVGPVPVLKFRHKLPLGDTFWWGSEIDGFYAPVSYLNGSDEDVVGAILDASLRGGVKVLDKGNLFLNLRYIGGGAVGTSEKENNLGDGYVNNWLHFLTVSAGASYDIF